MPIYRCAFNPLVVPHGAKKFPKFRVVENSVEQGVTRTNGVRVILGHFATSESPVYGSQTEFVEDVVQDVAVGGTYTYSQNASCAYEHWGLIITHYGGLWTPQYPPPATAEDYDYACCDLIFDSSNGKVNNGLLYTIVGGGGGGNARYGGGGPGGGSSYRSDGTYAAGTDYRIGTAFRVKVGRAYKGIDTGYMPAGQAFASSVTTMLNSNTLTANGGCTPTDAVNGGVGDVQGNRYGAGKDGDYGRELFTHNTYDGETTHYWPLIAGGGCSGSPDQSSPVYFPKANLKYGSGGAGSGYNGTGHWGYLGAFILSNSVTL